MVRAGLGQGSSFYSPRLRKSRAAPAEKTAGQRRGSGMSRRSLAHPAPVSVSGAAATTTRPAALQPRWLSEAGSGLIVHDGVYSAGGPHRYLPFPSSPPPPPPSPVLSAGPVAVGLRQRGANQHTQPPPTHTPHPQLLSINGPPGQSCCLCNMLTMLTVRREKEERRNRGRKEGKCVEDSKYIRLSPPRPQ